VKYDTILQSGARVQLEPDPTDTGYILSLQEGAIFASVWFQCHELRELGGIVSGFLDRKGSLILKQRMCCEIRSCRVCAGQAWWIGEFLGMLYRGEL
jgi:hypothetical protein